MTKRKKPLAGGKYAMYLSHADLLKLELFTRRTARGCREIREKLKQLISLAEEDAVEQAGEKK